MNRDLEEMLISETALEDVPFHYRDVAELIGIPNMVKLAKYAMGKEIYFPKAETIIRKARNRHIREEYTGYNENQLAQRFDLTEQQIKKILRGINPQQLDLFGQEAFGK